jgi:hypothetical protein
VNKHVIREVAKGPEQGGVGGRSSLDLEICILFSVTLLKTDKTYKTRGGESYVNFKSRGPLRPTRPLWLRPCML